VGRRSVMWKDWAERHGDTCRSEGKVAEETCRGGRSSFTREKTHKKEGKEKRLKEESQRLTLAK